MPRLEHHEVLQRFFPELRTSPHAEVVRRVGVQTCRLVLLDMLGAYRNARDEKGPGVLVIRMNGDQVGADYMPVTAIEGDMRAAERHGDGAAQAFFSDLISTIESTNHERYALFMMVENQGTAVVPVPFDNPEESIAEQLKELAP
jgi:hypothetical protein